ncbi:MAG: HAD family hydrolase [Marivibrio sp.]|uniref:HAD family hydrolase n=1 Tax=Marivibrio sp. TaxID=2039719 RepID=UPI0032F06515
MTVDLTSVDAVLFDKDGTLLDYHATWMPANRAVAHALSAGDEGLAARLLARGGYDPESGRVRAGSPLAAGDLQDIVDAWATLLPARLTQDPDALAARIDALFIRHCVPTPVTALDALFDALKARGLKLGVATADSEAGARASLGPFGLLERLDFLAGYDSGHGSKPGPGQALAFCDAAGVAPERLMVIGDNRHDVDMARAARARYAIGVLTGTTAASELAAIADAVFEDVGFLTV